MGVTEKSLFPPFISTLSIFCYFLHYFIWHFWWGVEIHKNWNVRGNRRLSLFDVSLLHTFAVSHNNIQTSWSRIDGCAIIHRNKSRRAFQFCVYVCFCGSTADCSVNLQSSWKSSENQAIYALFSHSYMVSHRKLVHFAYQDSGSGSHYAKMCWEQWVCCTDYTML